MAVTCENIKVLCGPLKVTGPSAKGHRYKLLPKRQFKTWLNLTGVISTCFECTETMTVDQTLLPGWTHKKCVMDNLFLKALLSMLPRLSTFALRCGSCHSSRSCFAQDPCLSSVRVLICWAVACLPLPAPSELKRRSLFTLCSPFQQFLSSTEGWRCQKQGSRATRHVLLSGMSAQDVPGFPETFPWQNTCLVLPDAFNIGGWGSTGFSRSEIASYGVKKGMLEEQAVSCWWVECNHFYAELYGGISLQNTTCFLLLMYVHVNYSI